MQQICADTILMQDLILVTDLISLPRLVEIFCNSEFSKRQLEKQLLG